VAILAEIKITLSKELLSLLAELVTGLNELAELVPEWNFTEKEKIVEEIKTIMSQLLELREK